MHLLYFALNTPHINKGFLYVFRTVSFMSYIMQSSYICFTINSISGGFRQK